MKKLLFFYCLTFCLTFNDLFSQKFFREGYIEKKSGELLTGLVEYNVSQGIPVMCIFKRFDIASVVSYNPSEIRSFGYKNGNRYVSKESDNKFSFYEALVIGEINLYKKGPDFFIDKNSQGRVKVENGNIKLSVNGTENNCRTLNEFLIYITDGKAGEIPDKFDIRKDLVPLIISNNKNSRKSFYVIKQSISEKDLASQISLSGSKKNRFGFFSGMNMYMLNLRLNPDVKYGNSLGYVPDPKAETGLMAGLTWERLLLRKSDKLAARLDILYTSQSFSCYNETTTSTYTTRDYAHFGFKGIKIPALLQYSFTGRRIVPFLNAGMAYQYCISGNYHHIEEQQSMTNEVNTTEDSDFKFKQGEISGLGGIGLKARLINSLNLNLQLRAEYGSGLFVNFNKKLENASYIVKKPYIQNSLQFGILLSITF